MKRLFPALLALLLLFSCACADDPFLDSFNGFASAMYGLPPAEVTTSNQSFTVYQSETYSVKKSFLDTFTVTGPLSDSADVLTAACCVLRAIAPSGSVIDQYGRIMHAYFMARSRDLNAEYRATTDTGILIVVSRTSADLIIRITP